MLNATHLKTIYLVVTPCGGVFVRSIIVVELMEDLWYASVLVSLDIRSRFRMELVLLKKLVQRPKRNGMSCFRFLFIVLALFMFRWGDFTPTWIQFQVLVVSCVLMLLQNFGFKLIQSVILVLVHLHHQHFIVTGDAQIFLWYHL